MDYNQLVAGLKQLGVDPLDVLRASLYYDYLELARTFFRDTLAGPVPPPGAAPGGLGPDYFFVRNAVQSAGLLKELADILDFFVGPTVIAELKRGYPTYDRQGFKSPDEYKKFFEDQTLDVDPGTYQGRLAAFRTRYPITAYALDKLYNNFTKNIHEACSRIIADRADLRIFYGDLYAQLSINSLDGIKSTGSDFHKGGKQVLILTFDISYTDEQGNPSTRGFLRVVYKPSDLEVDCLMVGDSAAVNRVDPAFNLPASLFEIYNQRLQLKKNADPTFTGEPVTTYRILPREYTSPKAPAGPLQALPIRDAYGYIQYLNNDLTGTVVQFWGFYPFGASDYLIFRSQDPESIIKKFYQQEGALTALAATFSIIDLHFENVRVYQYAPYLIDLEICLTKPISDVYDTALFYKDHGGVTGVRLEGQKFTWELRNNPAEDRDYFLERVDKPETFHNRLYAWKYNGQKRLVPVASKFLLQGFGEGMQVLREAQLAGSFTPWFNRLTNVLVRYAPFATPDFRAARNAVCISALEGDNPCIDFAVALTAVLQGSLEEKFKIYKQGNNPDFLAFTAVQSRIDFENLDIPVFYHRIGTPDIVNSRGEKVAIPQNVTINNNSVPLNLGRNTFFPNPPTENNVRLQQVVPLGDNAGYHARLNALTTTLTERLRVVKVPADINVLIPEKP